MIVMWFTFPRKLMGQIKLPYCRVSFALNDKRGNKVHICVPCIPQNMNRRGYELESLI